METKICPSCKIEKGLSEFRKTKVKPHFISFYCIECLNVRALKSYYIHKQRRKDIISKNNKIQREKQNKEETKRKRKIYLSENKEKINDNKRKYRANNRERVNENSRNYSKNRRNNDPLFRLSHNIRCVIRKSLKNKNLNKKSKTSDILGCSIEEFKIHLESKFESWMTWDNYGKYNGVFQYGWDIDHITPSSSAISEEDVIRLNHFSNLQPLCSKINRDIKRDNISLV